MSDKEKSDEDFSDLFTSKPKEAEKKDTDSESEAPKGEPGKPSEETVDASALKSALTKERSANRTLTKDLKALQEKMENFNKVFATLGLTGSGEAGKPEDASVALAAAEAKAKHKDLEMKVVLNSGEADPTRLLRDTQFQAFLSGFEGTDEELQAEVSAFVESSPWLKRETSKPEAAARGSVGAGQAGKKEKPEEDFRDLFRSR